MKFIIFQRVVKEKLPTKFSNKQWLINLQPDNGGKDKLRDQNPSNGYFDNEVSE